MESVLARESMIYQVLFLIEVLHKGSIQIEVLSVHLVEVPFVYSPAKIFYLSKQAGPAGEVRLRCVWLLTPASMPSFDERR